jgi:methyltransferase (TIGR00027 family)
MKQTAAQTGPGPTAIVAVEQHFPAGVRVIHDDLAGRILPFALRAFIRLASPPFVRDWMVRATEKKAPGAWAMALCRKRYIHDQAVEAVTGPAEAVVNLGAGFDTLAYRAPALAGVPVWEVDLPENMEVKEARLRKVLGRIPDHVTLVPIDFDREDLGCVLASHGYSAAGKTFFAWEGVTQYLTEAGVRATFDFLAGAPAGSRLVFTYVRRDFIEGEVLDGQEYLYQKMLLKDRIWLFGLDPADVAGFIGAYGWRAREHIGYDELAERYVRPTGRNLASLALERLVCAEKL